MPPLNAKDVLERDGLFVTLRHGVGSLLLQTIDSTDTRHESITDIHQHARGKEKGAHTENGHNTDHVNDDRMKGASLVSTEKVIPSKQTQGVGSTSPGVHEKQQEML